MGSGLSGLTLSRPLKIQHKPVTHVENFCATGSEAFRNACYAVASGAYDIAMAIGVEKLKDSGYSGLVVSAPANDGTSATVTAPASFSLLAPAYAKKYGVDNDELKDVLTRIAWKNHKNGALNPRAQFRKEVSKETIACSPIVAGPLGIFDCSGVSDGSAAAIIVRAEDAYKYTDHPIFVKALSFVAGPATGPIDPAYDYTTFHEVVASAEDAYPQAGITNPRAELAMAEVHDCFTPTELVLMEDLGFAERGIAWKEVLAGTYDLDGELPVNPDGGLKSFGHPIGASGLRMLFEAWTAAARRGRSAPDRLDRRRQDQGADPQPRRLAGRVRQLRLRGRLRARLTLSPSRFVQRPGRAAAGALRVPPVARRRRWLGVPWPMEWVARDGARWHSIARLALRRQWHSNRAGHSKSAGAAVRGGCAGRLRRRCTGGCGRRRAWRRGRRARASAGAPGRRARRRSLRPTPGRPRRRCGWTPAAPAGSPRARSIEAMPAAIASKAVGRQSGVGHLAGERRCVLEPLVATRQPPLQSVDGVGVGCRRVDRHDRPATAGRGDGERQRATHRLADHRIGRPLQGERQPVRPADAEQVGGRRAVARQRGREHLVTRLAERGDERPHRGPGAAEAVQAQHARHGGADALSRGRR